MNNTDYKAKYERLQEELNARENDHLLLVNELNSSRAQLNKITSGCKLSEKSHSEVILELERKISYLAGRNDAFCYCILNSGGK